MDINTLLFDTTDTLYFSPELEAYMKNAPIEFVMHKGNSRSQAELILGKAKEKVKAEGGPTTKSHLITVAGFTNEDWQNFLADNDVTKYLSPVQENAETLRQLASKYKLGVITNINTRHLKKTLAALGCQEEWFSSLVTSDETPESKPSTVPFRIAIEKAGVPPSKICYVGDSTTKDIEPARLAGMKTVWLDYKNKHNAGDEQAFDKRINKLPDLLKIF